MRKPDLSTFEAAKIRYELAESAYTALVALCEQSEFSCLEKNTLIACEALRAELFRERNAAHASFAGLLYHENTNLPNPRLPYEAS